MQSNQNIYFYVLKLTLVTAAILAVLYNALEPMHKANKEAAKKRAILKCIPDVDQEKVASASAKEIEAIFDENIEAKAVKSDGTVFDDVSKLNSARSDSDAPEYGSFADVDLALEEELSEDERVYPMYIYKSAKGNFYVAAVRGNGLWDKIWGYVALKDDLNTVAGVFFDHKAETPGLGAEIKDSEDFKGSFDDKKVYKGDQVRIAVRKKGVENENYDIQAISGATVTSDGVTDMLHKGFRNYKKYFDSIKKKS